MALALARTQTPPFDVDAHPPVLHRAPCGEVAAPPSQLVQGPTHIGDTIEASFDAAVGRAPLRRIEHLELVESTPELADVLDDILCYRRLRNRLLAGERLSRGDRRLLDDLEARLRAREETLDDGRPNAREFHRFPLRFAAVLRTDDDTRSVFIEDISAGGVKLSLLEPPEEGARVWLAIERDDRGVAVLPARVVWVRPGVAGLMFAGAPFVA